MRTRKNVLRLNAVFLLLVSLAQATSELLSYFLGVGPLAGKFTSSPYTIGFFEAHSLATLIGLILFKASLGEPERFWHIFAVSVHLLLGGANILFWDSFVTLDFVGPGIVATFFHGIFVVTHTGCYLQANSETDTK